MTGKKTEGSRHRDVLVRTDCRCAEVQKAACLLVGWLVPGQNKVGFGGLGGARFGDDAGWGWGWDE